VSFLINKLWNTKNQFFPDGIPVLSVEAAATRGWEKYAHFSHGIDTFGASGTGPDLQKEFKMMPSDIVEKAKKVVEWSKGKTLYSLVDKPF